MNPFRGTDCTIMRANSNYKLYFITFTENTKDGGGGSGHKPGMNGGGADGYILCEWNNSMVVIWCAYIITDSCNFVS